MTGILGLIRRAAGAVGVALVAFGVASQEDGASLTSNVEAIIGGVLFLVDFIPSVASKIKGAFGGESK